MSNASSDRLTLLAHLHMQRDFSAQGIEYREPMADVPGRQVDIPKLKRGGVDCIWLSEGAPGEFTVDPMAVLQAGEHPSTQMFRRTFLRVPRGCSDCCADSMRCGVCARSRTTWSS